MSGQLGSGRCESSSVPRLLDTLASQRIVQIVCHGDFSLALTASGDVYSWGNGDDGQLGHGKAVNELLPRMVQGTFGKGIVEIAAGNRHACALTSSGDVYAWGLGEGGRLGLGDSRTQLTPRLLKSLRQVNVIHIACGERHSLALTSEGQVYSWGAGANGRLGHGDELVQSAPRLIQTSGMVSRFVARIAAGGAHSAALTDGGAAWLWGCGDEGQLGHGDVTDAFVPKELTTVAEPIASLALGTRSTYLVTLSGKGLACGCNQSGQLGLGDTINALIPKPVKILGEESSSVEVMQCAAGFEHVFALCKSKRPPVVSPRRRTESPLKLRI
jgi:E3 ubiquitin-protein ligase HERC2